MGTRRTASFRLVLGLLGPTLAGAQDPPQAEALTGTPEPVVFVSGAGTPAGRALATTLAGEYIVLDGRDRPVHLPRGTTYATSVVVLTPRLTTAARVQGSVVVIDGDLFLHPGARVGGDAIAIGGGVYVSALATLEGDRLPFRDETFTAQRVAGRIELTHSVARIQLRERVVNWPLGIGLRMPSYNRVDGLVLPWGPTISLRNGRLTVDPVLTYRSHIGALDPGTRVVLTGGSVTLTADARRGTFSNDRWIRSELLNTISTLWGGRDRRNYYRADRGEVRIARRLTPGTVVIEPYIGALAERAWSTGQTLSREHHPWSLFGRDSIDGIFRPNPAVLDGRIESALGGVRLRWAAGGVETRFTADIERSWRVPDAAPGDFTQATLHGSAGFPTFGTQRLESQVRAVISSGGERLPPPQRFAYIGGWGTIPTMDLLEEGGSELFFFESNYLIPLQMIDLPFIGSPTFTIRYMAGSAGVDSLPRLTQNVGARLGTRFFGIEYLIDPATSEKAVGVGFRITF